MYFRNFPYVSYEFPDGNARNFKNLSLRAAISEELYNSNNLETYIVKDGETPETIAYDMYNDVNMHWIIMLTNNVLNLYDDWPKTQGQFDDYLYYKYQYQNDSDGNPVQLRKSEVREYVEFVGNNNNLWESRIELIDYPGRHVLLRPKGFEDNNGDLFSYHSKIDNENLHDAFGNVVLDNEDLYPVSYWAWENELNEKKRELSIPIPEIAQRINSVFKELINE